MSDAANPGDPQPAQPTAAAAAAPPSRPAPAGNERVAVGRTKSLLAAMVRWIKGDLKRSLVYAGIGLAISWFANVVIIAAVYNGIAKVPAGAAVTAPSTTLTGSIVWVLGMALAFGVIEYARAVGSKRFWADVRGFPKALTSLVRADGAKAVPHLLWGFAGAMLAAAVMSGSVALVLGLGSLALLASVLRPIMSGLLMLAWRKVVGTISKNWATPPSETVLAVTVVGIVLALIGAYLLPTTELKVVAAVAAGALAFVRSQPGARATGVTAVVVGVAVGVGLALVAQPVFAHDGGFRECGADWGAWLGCGGAGSVLQNGLTGGIVGAGGTVVGSGLGNGLGKDRIRRGWGATFEGGFDGFMDQVRFLGERDVADPLSVIAALTGAPREALVTDGSRKMRDFLDSGGGRDLYEEFAADPLKFANDHGIGDWLREFPTEDHGPITRDDMDRYGALYDEYNQAVAAGDDYNANRLRGMLAATTVWIGGQFIEPGMAAEGIAGRFGTRAAAGGLERVAISELGTAERQALSHIPADFPLDATQRALLDRGLITLEEIQKGGVNQSMRIVFDDGGRAIIKPESGATSTMYEKFLEGPKYSREVGTYVTDRHLDFNMVPATAVMDHPELGRSSVQAWSESKPFKGGGEAFSAIDQQKAAVLDYVTGNLDRHMGNALQSPDGRLILIDHGESFPTKGATNVHMTNEFVNSQFGTTLDAGVVKSVQSVDQAAFRADLVKSGLTEGQADAALSRLNEIATNGKITGQTLNGGVLKPGKGYEGIKIYIPPKQ